MTECYFCGRKVASVSEAIERDWSPSFYDGDREVAEPFCPQCAREHLRVGDDGEFERRPASDDASWTMT